MNSQRRYDQIVDPRNYPRQVDGFPHGPLRLPSIIEVHSSISNHQFLRLETAATRTKQMTAPSSIVIFKHV